MIKTKHLKKYIACLTVFSIGCQSPLPIELCYITENSLRCYKNKEKHYYFRSIQESQNYIALSPKDAEFVLNYYKTKCHK